MRISSSLLFIQSQIFRDTAKLYRRFLTPLLLPLDDDKIISGNLGFVAIWVTHPLWPCKVDLSDNCSPIFSPKFYQFTTDENRLKVTTNKIPCTLPNTHETEVGHRWQSIRSRSAHPTVYPRLNAPVGYQEVGASI